jgi:hypothetical protein
MGLVLLSTELVRAIGQAGSSRIVIGAFLGRISVYGHVIFVHVLCAEQILVF